jgi:hypothetical protein
MVHTKYGDIKEDVSFETPLDLILLNFQSSFILIRRRRVKTRAED